MQAALHPLQHSLKAAFSGTFHHFLHLCKLFEQAVDLLDLRTGTPSNPPFA